MARPDADRRSLIRAALAGCLLLAGAPAFAQAPSSPPVPSVTPTQRPRLRDACAADVQRFCPQVHPGQGRLTRCLRRRNNQLQRSCRLFLRRLALPR